jgi:hypothetical protein
VMFPAARSNWSPSTYSRIRCCRSARSSGVINHPIRAGVPLMHNPPLASIFSSQASSSSVIAPAVRLARNSATVPCICCCRSNRCSGVSKHPCPRCCFGGAALSSAALTKPIVSPPARQNPASQIVSCLCIFITSTFFSSAEATLAPAFSCNRPPERKALMCGRTEFCKEGVKVRPRSKLRRRTANSLPRASRSAAFAPQKRLARFIFAPLAWPRKTASIERKRVPVAYNPAVEYWPDRRNSMVCRLKTEKVVNPPHRPAIKNCRPAALIRTRPSGAVSLAIKPIANDPPMFAMKTP